MTEEKNLELNLGKACNNRCIFCLDRNAPESARRWLPIERAVEELKKARNNSIRLLGLLGGEPTAHPYIIDIVREAKNLGFTRIAIGSNGLKLADREFAKKLIDNGLTRVSISIHSYHDYIEDYLTGKKGNFEKKIKAIDNLVELLSGGKLPDNVSINAVITRYLAGRMIPFCIFFKRKGIKDIRFNLIRTDTCMERSRELTPRLSEISPEIIKLIATNEKVLKMEISFGDIPLCIYPWSILENRTLVRKYVGELRDYDTYCSVFLEPKNPQSKAQRFSWRQRKRNALKVKLESCEKCKAERVCEGIWKSYIKAHGTNEFKPIMIDSFDHLTDKKTSR